MIAYILIISILFFISGYIFYGRYLEKKLDVSRGNKTPAHTMNDGIDYCPANKFVLFGHHFSSIAGAGPIVGPIAAALIFGWLPALLWILIGSVFIGGVHDFASLVASIKHKAKSISELAKEYISGRAYKLFLAFTWLALIYVLTVFIDLTVNTFTMNGGVASSSVIYIFLAVAFGLCLYRLKIKLGVLTAAFVLMIFAGIFAGQKYPLVFVNGATIWRAVLLAYCFVASVLPVWMLLQPRDYLSSFLLYISVIVGVSGILMGSNTQTIEFPAFIAWHSEGAGGIFPMLFVMVACGAVSGFHSLVASGTTAKQLCYETDAKPVAYGGMLLEGVVAVIALSTVMLLTKRPDLTSKSPLSIYANGLGQFGSMLGLNRELCISFGMLTISTFMLTTLDTATRISRYILQEFLDLKEPRHRYMATAITLILPSLFIFLPMSDAGGNPVPSWKIIWPVFGATNQLLAALALLSISVWLKRRGKNIFFVAIPAVFMLIVTSWAVVLLVVQYGFNVVGITAAVLLVLSFVLLLETIKIFRKTTA
ncbi:MAG: carbon starvation CstA family protein [Elusimicrobiota bacterium]